MRLGYNRRWNAGYFPISRERPNLLYKQIFIQKFITDLFSHYGLPQYILKKKTRNIRLSDGKIKSIGERGIIKNPLIRQGIYYSHQFSSLSNGKVTSNIFFLDQGLINFKKNYRKRRRLSSLEHFHFDGKKRKKAWYPGKLFSHLIARGRLKKLQKKIRKTIRKSAKRKPKKKSFFHFFIQKKLKLNRRILYPIGIYDYMFFQRGSLVNPNYGSQKPITQKLIEGEDNKKKDLNQRLRKLIRLFKVAVKILTVFKDYRRKFLFIKTLQPIVQTLLYVIQKIEKFAVQQFKIKLKKLVPKKYRYKKKWLFRGKKNVRKWVKRFKKKRKVKKKYRLLVKKRKKLRTLSTLMQKLFFCLILSDIHILKTRGYLNSLTFKMREPIFKGLAKVIHHTIFNNLNYPSTTISFFAIHLKQINAHLILKWIERRLAEYIPIYPILGEVQERLRKVGRNLIGYKIMVTGRLTRKERAAVILRNRGSVSTSTYKTNIDYASGFKILKFGIAV